MEDKKVMQIPPEIQKLVEDYLYRNLESTNEFLAEIVYKALTDNPESILCFNNLGFCCALEKPCPKRDIALILYNIPPEEYTEIKRLVGEVLKDKEKRGKLLSFLRSLYNGGPSP